MTVFASTTSISMGSLYALEVDSDTDVFRPVSSINRK